MESRRVGINSDVVYHGGMRAWAGVSMVNAGVSGSYGVSSGGGWGGTWGGGVGDSLFAGIIITAW